jgi:hypothetical protein
MVAERLTKASLILPPGPEELKAIARMADVAGRADTNGSTWAFNLFAKGFAEYRLGHYGSAADLLQGVFPLDVTTHCRTEALLVLAMTQHQLGRTAESRTSLAQAEEAIGKKLPRAGQLTEEWNDWITIQFLEREAKAMIEGSH